MDALLILCVLASLALTPLAPPAAERAFAASTPSVPIEPWWPGLELRPLPEAAAPVPTIRDPQAATLLAAGPPTTVTVTANPISLHANGSSTATITATVTDLTGTLVDDGTMVGFTVTTGLGSFPYAYVESSDSTVTKTGGFLTSQLDSNASGGDIRQSNVTGDYVRWTFTGTAVSLIHNTQGDGGEADVTVDGLYTRTVDMYSADQTWQVETVISNTLPPSPHTITVTVKGTHHLSSSGYYVFVDAFRSGTTTSGGKATATLTAGTTPGLATVWATALGSSVTGTTTVVMGKVRNMRTGEWFADIQAAIDDADTVNGDTIAADAGTYTGPITVTKSISLTGAGAANTVIEGTSPAVVITANNTLLSGFTISNTTVDYGVWIKGANNVTVTNNIIRNNSWGVVVNTGASGALISNNSVFSNTEGIVAGYGSGASGTVIRDNNVYSNSWGIDLGAGASGARVFHNNIYGNTAGQGWDSGSANLWDNGYPSAGNYWGDYTGKDADTLAMVSGNGQSGVIFTTLPSLLVVRTTGDGIGNTSYLVLGGAGARDYHPLMQPSGWLTAPTPQPTVGVPITFTIVGTPAGATGQSLSPTSLNTGADGQVASQFTLGSKVGIYTITAQAAGAVGSPVTFAATAASTGTPYTITLAAVPAVLRADGISTATITATVQDAGGNPLSDVTVGVTATRGTTGLSFVEGEGTEVTKSPGGAWTEVINPLASGGKYIQSNGAFYPTASASWTFTASTISLLYVKNSLGGIAAVQVDSSLTMLIDMYSAVTTFDEYIVTWLDTERHTITVTQTSPPTNNPNSGGYFIYADAFRSAGRTDANGNVLTWLRSSNVTSTSTVRATALGSGPLFYTETNVIFAWPPAITFTASITPVVLSCGITDTITATVSNGGYPISGTPVTFTVSPGTLGNVNLPTTTDANGQAVTVFTPNKVGTGVITATSTGISNTLPVTVKAGPPITPTLSASPGQLVATGNTTAAVTLTATDACDNAVADGTLVGFQTSLGNIAPEHYIAQYNDARISRSGSWSLWTADCSGYYYTNDLSAVATYTFTGTAVSLIYRQHPTYGVAKVWIDGVQIKTITQTGTDACDQKVPIAAGLVLGTHVLTMTWSSGGIVVFQGFESGGATFGGMATGVLTSTRLADTDPMTRTTVTITGTVYGSTVTGTTSVVFGKPVVSLTVTPGKSTLIANGVDTTTLTANVRDAFGNLSPNGTLGGFAITPGFGPTTPVYDRSEAEQSAGASNVTRSGWTSEDTYTAGPCAGTVVAYTTSSADVLTYTFTGTAVAFWYPKRNDYGVLRVWLDGSLAGIVNQTGTSATAECGFRALITDSLAYSTHVMTVTLQAGSGTYGVIDAFESGGATKSGTGQLNGFLTADGKVGTAMITATASGSAITNTTTVTFTVGPPLTVTLGQSAYTVTCSSPGTVTATVLAYGNNVVTDGTKVTFTTNLAGTSSSPNPGSTVNGVVTTTVSGTTADSGVFTATATATVFDTASLTVNAGSPASLVLTRHPTSIFADNVSTALITATVRDACGNLVADNTPVTFNTSLGTIVESPPRLTSGGVATSTLRSGLSPGPATVTVTAGTQVSTTIVYFTGAPWTITVTAAPSSIPVGGATSAVTATVRDVFGNPISDGTVVTFTTSLDTIVETQPRLTSGGVATTTLASGAVVGTAIVTATADSRFGTTSVVFTPGPLDHFVFAPIGTQQAGVTFGLTITAQDVYSNTATSYTGSNVLADSTATITPTTTGNFSNGVWSGNVTIFKARTGVVITTTGSSKVGVSNPFTVTPGAPYTVTVTASPTSIPIVTGSAAVTATVRDVGGDPVADGTVVTFTTTLGAISPLTRTTTNGVATAVLTSGSTSGTAVVVATAGSRWGSINVTFTPGPAASIALAAYPTSIPIGGLTSTLTATVRDQYANLVTDNTVVTFATSLGDFFLASTITKTTTGGMATAALTSGLLMGTATVTATVGAISGTTTVTFTPGLPFTVALVAVPPSMPVGGSTSTVTATVVDRYNNHVTDGTVVTFATSLGTTAPPTCPTSSGLATATLTSGNFASTATVTATAGMASGTTPVTFTPGLPFTVTLTANPTSIPVGGITSTLMATVRDQYGNSVTNNTPVTFTTSLGSITEAQPRLTSNGAATATLTSGNMAGPATIIALADSHAGNATVQFLPLAPFTVTVMASPANIPVGGDTAITATVTDQYGNLATNGTVVTFATSLGAIIPPTRTTTSGVATATLNALTVAGMATVTATAGTALGTTPVTFTAGAPFTVTLVVSPTTTVVGTFVALTATVRDQFNNPVGGAVVYYQASPGSTDPLTNTTNAVGVATSTVTSQIIGPTMVTATAGSRVGTAVVTFTPGLPFTVTLVAVPPSIPVGGITSTVTATVVDRYNNRVTDGTVVTFATSLGTIAPLTQPTTGGVATSTLTSGNIAGTAMVTATAGIAVGTLPITFTAGAPFTVTVAAFPTSTVVGAPVVITAAVQDQYANPVTDGTVVTFATSLGSLAPPTGTTTSGSVAAALTSTIAGPAIVTATVGARWGTTIVTFMPGVPFTVTVRASPLSIHIGGDTSTVTATARDQYGNLVSDGVLVNFSTSLGTVSPSSTGTVSGAVTTTLISGLITGTARVYAYSGVASGSVEVTFTVGPPHRVIVVAQPPTITVSTGTSVIGATVLDIGNNTVANGTVVTFATSLGTINPLMATTTNGVAQTTLSASAVAGTAVVTAAAGMVSGTTTVVFAPGPPATMTLVAFPTSIHIGGDTSAITATVRDLYSNFVANGTGVNFATGLGTFQQSGSTTYYTTTTGGIATATLVSGLSIGIAQVSAAAGGVLRVTEVTFTIGPPRYVTVTALPTSIPIVNGSSTVTAIVRDVGNNPVANGTVVTFATNLGAISPPTATTISGLALATLTSSTRTGTAIVTATVDSRVGTTNVTFTTPYPPELVVVTAYPTQIQADGVSTSTITVTVTEIYGNPVADGITVYFFVTAGATIAPANAPTVGGIARATLTAGSTPTTVTVRAVAGSRMGYADVVLYPPPPYKFYLPVLYKNYSGGW